MLGSRAETRMRPLLGELVGLSCNKHPPPAPRAATSTHTRCAGRCCRTPSSCTRPGPDRRCACVKDCCCTMSQLHTPKVHAKMEHHAQII